MAQPDYQALTVANEQLIQSLNIYTTQLPLVHAQLQPLVALQQQQADNFDTVHGQIQALQAGQHAMQAQLGNLEAQLGNLEVNINQQFAMLNQRLIVTDLRSQNRALNNTQHLFPLPNLAGQFPEHFPQTHTAIASLTGAHLDGLLGFYGIPIQGLVEDKKRTLATHIGREW